MTELYPAKTSTPVKLNHKNYPCWFKISDATDESDLDFVIVVLQIGTHIDMKDEKGRIGRCSGAFCGLWV